MELQVNVFDVWAFRKTASGIEYLLLHTSQQKADRHFNGGRFWQIPSGTIEGSEKVVEAVVRLLKNFGLTAAGICFRHHDHDQPGRQSSDRHQPGAGQGAAAIAG